MAGKRIYLTDGAGIFKIKKLVRAAVLINLETKETVIAEVLGSQVAGFAIVKLPRIEGVTAQPRPPGRGHKRTKFHSEYYGVGKSKSKKMPWRAQVWDSKQKRIINIGSFKTDKLAAEAVDAKLIEMGRPPRNFPQARKEG